MKNSSFHKELKIVIILLITSTILLPSLNGDYLKIIDLKQNTLINNNNLVSTLYVGGSGPSNYSTIQAAINAATSYFFIKTLLSEKVSCPLVAKIRHM